MKLSKNPRLTKVAYEKNGNIYVRSGEDGFKYGRKLTVPVSTLWLMWGYRPTEDVPYFLDGEEIEQNLNKFQLTSKGKIKYFG